MMPGPNKKASPENSGNAINFGFNQLKMLEAPPQLTHNAGFFKRNLFSFMQKTL